MESMGRIRRRFVICLRKADCVDIELRNVYAVLPDAAAAKDGYLRVVDESGEVYPVFWTTV
jgi:hypothetical protein